VTASNTRWAATLVAAALAVVSPLAGQAPTGSPVAGAGLIAGQVLDADTGRGIPGVVVAVLAAPSGGQGAARRGTVYTDAQGRFAFPALTSGQYLAAAQATGYATVNGQRTLILGEGARVVDVRFVLRRRGSITGVVRDDSGDPVVGVEVLGLRRLTQAGRPPTLSATVRTRTNDRGEYRLAGLDAHDYLICACSRDPIPFDGLLLTTLAARPVDLLAIAARAVTGGADAVAFEGALRTLPPTFHPATTLAADAERITLRGGEDKTAVDITMTSTPAVKVSGRIVGAPSSVNASFIRLRAVGDVPEAFALTQLVPMLVQPDGRFDFGNVPPGQYVLDVHFRPGQRGGGPSGAALAFVGARGALLAGPPGPPQRVGGPPSPALDPLWASQLISVGESDVTGLVIGLNRSLALTGRVEFVGGTPQPTAQMRQRVSVELMSLQMGTQLRSYVGRPDAEGRFEVRGIIPGQYAMSYGGFSVPGWATLRSITAGGVDITDTVLDVDMSDIPNVVVTVADTPAASIQGRVRLAQNDIAETFTVRIFPVDRKYWAQPFGAVRRFLSTRPSADGSFTFSTVPAGEYFIAVVPAGQNDSDMDTLDTLSRTADRIRVADGQRVIAELRR
jgi:hypothetical protein